MKKEKRTFEYKCKMIFKLIFWLLPLILFLLSLINNSVLHNHDSNNYANQISGIFSWFASRNINSWYSNLLTAIGLQNLSFPSSMGDYMGTMLGLFEYYPLYLLWVELFDLVLHCFLILPKLGHKLLGESD